MSAVLTATSSVGSRFSTQAPLPQRRFGKTNERVPLLGLGTGPGGIGLPDAEAIPLYEAALGHGITYLDTAPGYGRAHFQLGELMPEWRSRTFLATKCYAGTAEEALKIHAQSLQDLRVDSVDLLYAHCVGSFEVEQLLAPDGVFAGLREARRRGWTRYLGFTAHHHPGKSEELLRLALSGDLEVDAVMLAMNYVDRHTYGFENRVLPLAGQLDLGVAVMKVFGGAREMNYEKNRDSQLGARNHFPAFRYALGLPGAAVAVVGMFTVAEVEKNAAWARNWSPLTGEEEDRLEGEGREIAAEWGAHFGAVS
ncbi:MAG: aldo/keto reductase [Armatimonadetes bacterium]|nr:aldo/keto reductase [Armatimonadota bacterium]